MYNHIYAYIYVYREKEREREREKENVISCRCLLNHLQLFCDTIDSSLPDSSVHGISQARILEWVAIFFSRGSSWPRDRTHLSCIGRWILHRWPTRDAPRTWLLLSRFSRVRLCNPIDGSPPGFPVPGILQARTLEWVAISFSNAWKWKVKVKSLSSVWLLATPWSAAYQAPPSMGFSRQKYWSGVPLPSPTTKVKWVHMGGVLIL